MAAPVISSSPGRVAVGRLAVGWAADAFAAVSFLGSGKNILKTYFLRRHDKLEYFVSGKIFQSGLVFASTTRAKEY